MSFYLKEPDIPEQEPAHTGILLINLGTPNAPTAKALRPYLRQFLSDRRVIEIPRAIWWFILNGAVLPFRPRQSSHKYAAIWDPEGSPLMVHSQRQARLLSGALHESIASPYVVELGMRYGQPSVGSAIAKLKAKNCQRILLFPLYPQYAGSSSASAIDEAMRTLLRTRNMPEIRTIRDYHSHPAYIGAIAESIRLYWQEHGTPEKLLMSFHGVPRRTCDLGDPYRAQCLRSGRLIAEALQLRPEQYMVTFQSRFGAAEWLQPYFAPTIETLGKQKLRRVDVVCPGFSSDCLETLEEIAMEGKHLFLEAGGGEYHYIPALNERDTWINAMRDIALENLQGWITPR
ncbi:ferrochelatase [Methylobacillus rhizosphaerae]|uniref:Ferrochelatase n=1 Tax=Methylobacillus rhizosphaerae TaxID=551994 RepID=A0A239AH76_9PROT|nr:ferrochelatase [Methylobacillus rhizosphaerae]SNR94900.1 ferrochelatase [Methylobacillus rhizosphaerae]